MQITKKKCKYSEQPGFTKRCFNTSIKVSHFMAVKSEMITVGFGRVVEGESLDSNSLRVCAFI